MGAQPFALRRAIAALATLGALGVAVVGAGRTASARTPRPPRLPFALPADARTLLAQVSPARDRVRVVVYASATCPHCHAEAARWARLAATEPELLRAVQVVFVVATPGGATGDLALGASFSQVADTGAHLAQSLHATTVPTTLVVDATGAVRAHSVGEHSDSALRALVWDAARFSPPRPPATTRSRRTPLS